MAGATSVPRPVGRHRTLLKRAKFAAVSIYDGQADNALDGPAPGAFRWPAARRTGHKTVHLGGPTQLLIGTRSRRWDAHPT